MGLWRYTLDEAVLAVKVDVEASRFHAGVDDMSCSNRCDEIKKCISFCRGILGLCTVKAKFPQMTTSGRGYSAIAPLLKHTE